LVTERANGRCEYCLVPQTAVFVPHQPDHIIAEQHGGQTDSDNLALACIHCNRRKGPNIASIEPLSNELTFLFNPRTQQWQEHFLLDAAAIQPLTAVGRVTINVLQLNSPERLEVRQALIEEGDYP
jgi:hypothetical protein